jgi:hypothetical protein
LKIHIQNSHNLETALCPLTKLIKLGNRIVSTSWEKLRRITYFCSPISLCSFSMF